MAFALKNSGTGQMDRRDRFVAIGAPLPRDDVEAEGLSAE